MSVIPFKRKPRPLRRTYNPDAPYVVERVDDDSGSCKYEVVDTRPDSCRIVCIIHELEYEDKPMLAKWEADNIAAALNLRFKYGEKLPQQLLHID